MKRRMISLALVLTLLVGCSPVVTNNDLSFAAYDPAPYYDSVGYDAVESAVSDRVLDYDSYNIGGTEAFYTLPYHGNNPNDVFQVNVLDYTSDGYIVYGYMAYYYGNATGNNYSTSAGGLTCSATGTASAAVEKSEDMVSGGDGWGDPTHVVAVLMKFNPTTRKYMVYHTGLETLEAISITTSSEDTGTDPYAVYTIENGLYTQSIQGGTYYFICYENTGYVYNADTRAEHLSMDYYERLLQTIEYYGISTTDMEVEIMDIVMDDMCFAYLTTTLSGESDMSSLDSDDDDADIDEPETQIYLFGCYFLPLEYDGDVILDPEADDYAVFRSEITNLQSVIDTYESFDSTVKASDLSAIEAALGVDVGLNNLESEYNSMVGSLSYLF